MNELFTYKDETTGFEIMQFTRGPEKNTKLYFTTENFTLDDRYFFFHKSFDDPKDPRNGLYRAEVSTGDYVQVVGSEYGAFVLDKVHNFGLMTKGNIVYKLDCDTWKLTRVGAFPEGEPSGHLTISNDGTIVSGYKFKNCIWGIVIMDIKTGESQTIFKTDYWIGHTQVCPTDSNLILYVHETRGDALQRMWMFDRKMSKERPYYVEEEDEWITHEVWTADGENVVFMKLNRDIMMGTKDGHCFRSIAQGDQLLHPGVSMDKKHFCADRTSYWGNKSPNYIYYFNETGELHLLAETGTPKDGSNHMHPSFNRKGDMILFSKPPKDDKDGNAQVCLIDLKKTGLI